jgi:transcriptional regulator with XRE-family HTH domain
VPASQPSSEGELSPNVPPAVETPRSDAAKNSIGERLRALRRARHLSLSEVAHGCGVSPSLLSQVERNIASPSLGTLYAVSQFLEVPIFRLFMTDDQPVEAVVRHDRRKRVMLPGSEIAYEVVTPDMQRRMEILELVLEPGQMTIDEPLPHPGDECAVVLEGCVTVVLGAAYHALHEGDSIYFDATTPHRYGNKSPSRARVLIVITPPTF